MSSYVEVAVTFGIVSALLDAVFGATFESIRVGVTFVTFATFVTNVIAARYVTDANVNMCGRFPHAPPGHQCQCCECSCELQHDGLPPQRLADGVEQALCPQRLSIQYSDIQGVTQNHVVAQTSSREDT